MNGGSVDSSPIGATTARRRRFYHAVDDSCRNIRWRAPQRAIRVLEQRHRATILQICIRRHRDTTTSFCQRRWIDRQRNVFDDWPIGHREQSPCILQQHLQRKRSGNVQRRRARTRLADRRGSRRGVRHHRSDDEHAGAKSFGDDRQLRQSPFQRRSATATSSRR